MFLRVIEDFLTPSLSFPIPKGEARSQRPFSRPLKESTRDFVHSPAFIPTIKMRFNKKTRECKSTFTLSLVLLESLPALWIL